MEKKTMTELIELLKSEVKTSIELSSAPTDQEIEEAIETVVFNWCKENYLSLQDKQLIISRLFNSMRRLDILQPLLEDESITEIMVNGPANVFVERGGKLQPIEASFESSKKLEDVIQNIVSKINRIVNEATPIVDARLQDGSRVNVVLPPIALNGPILTIRRFPDKPITMEELIEIGSISKEAAEFLKLLVEAKYNILICGGTGSGKTTFLNVLSNFIPADERVITIEDAAELQLSSMKNLVRLETRNANIEGKGEIGIRALLKASLRMRPDRIIVGEVRGAEAIDMLQAMNTGHEGSLTTGHANSTKDMLSRLETMVLSGVQIPLEAIRRQIASAIDIIIFISRMRDKSRRVIEISEVIGYHEDEIHLNKLYSFLETSEGQEGLVLGRLVTTEQKLQKRNKLRMAGVK